MNSRVSRLLLLFVLCTPSAFAQRGVPISEQLAFTPYHASGIYDVGETVGWTVTPGPAPPTYAYKWTIRRNNAVVLKEGTLDLSSGKATIEIVGRPARDDLRGGRSRTRIWLRRRRAPRRASLPRFIGGNTGRNTGFYAVGAAVAPTKIGLSTPRPADFDAFWDAQARRAGEDSDQRRADAGRDRRAGRRAEHVRARRARVEGARLRREAGARGQVSRRHPAAVRRRLRAQRRAPPRGAPPKAG